MGNPALSFRAILDSILDSQSVPEAQHAEISLHTRPSEPGSTASSESRPSLDLKLDSTHWRKAYRQSSQPQKPSRPGIERPSPFPQAEKPIKAKPEAEVERASLSIQGELALKVLAKLSGLEEPKRLSLSWLKRAYRLGALKHHPDRRLSEAAPSLIEGAHAFSDLHASLVILKQELKTLSQESSV